MLRVLFLDLGETLVHDDRPLPFVPEALAALNLFETENAGRLAMGLVSDWHAARPPTDARIGELFESYLLLLAQSQLRAHFEPIEQRVTLSTHAGVRKPDRRVFDLALERLSVGANFEECLFVTENRDHLSACKNLGMQTLTFGADNPAEGFTAWPEGVMLIAHRVAPHSRTNLEAALSVWGGARHQCEHVKVSALDPDGRLQASAQCWTVLQGAEHHELDGVNVLLPGQIDVRLDALGLPQLVDAQLPDAETLVETRAYVDRLASRNQISEDPLTTDPNKTHIIESLPDGRRFLKRRGYN